MSKGKTEKFAEFDSFDNSFDYRQQTKGKWKDFFGNNNPLVLELACGKGDYTLGLAGMFPDKNFVGCDIKGSRLWKGAKAALNAMPNVAFLRIRIDDVADFFEANEVAEIWITFPDPQPSKARKRLTHPKFLNPYRQIMGGAGRINLKTDSDSFYEFTKEVIAQNGLQVYENIPDVYAAETPPILQIQTYYEKMWLAEGRSIKFIAFELDRETVYVDEGEGREK